ncbi:AP-3 complex subunit mu-1-like isoform X4 [Xenia sp. Carnegie-2017]|uniref:AP-3 complex subunit mu-1-like isoform X4 n=1 Tax=Xenia sp. Carnegie-2017 TaxID=2897299 RepID=UPI001F04849C|nr:AP-3 complex subunit mu-1-like isoform X4 [Xenia sp. Carnegie-2017]
MEKKILTSTEDKKDWLLSWFCMKVSLNKGKDIFLEKNWRSVLGCSVCDYIFEAQGKATSPEDIPPVIATGFSYLISIFRHDLFFVSVVENEVPPLFVIEFLHRVVDLIKEYFSDCTETIIKENCVILLEEMLDNGFPLATESNVLKELIRPPSIVRNVVNKVTGDSNMSSHLPTGQLSNVPWRRTGVKYANNEIYFDVAESIDAIIDKQGSSTCVLQILVSLKMSVFILVFASEDGE